MPYFPRPVGHALPALSTLVRGIACVGVASSAALAGFGPRPVRAQVPDLLSTTTTSPGTTTTTLLPPLESLTAPTTAPPSGSDPGPTLLPTVPTVTAPLTSPAPAPAPSRTTTFRPDPIPRASAGSRVAPAPHRSQPSVADDPAIEEIDPSENGEFGSTLPFDAGPSDPAVQDDTMELGLGASHQEEVGMVASIAAGLIALVLLGVVGWVQKQVRQSPSPSR